MALQFNGSNYLHYGTGMFSSLPITLFCWAKNPSSGSDETIGGVERNVTPWERAVIYSAGSGVTFANYRDASGSAGVSSPISASTDWRPMMAVFTTATRKMYYGASDVVGGTETSGVGDVASQLINWYIGRGVLGNFSGEIAEFALWNTALGDADWATLKAGALPETVSSGSLVDLLTMQTAGDYTSLNGRVLTLNGSAPTQTTHPISRAASVVLSGEAVLAGITADGSMAPQPDSSIAGEAILAGITADGGMGLAPGVITTPVLKNNTGTILASVSGIVANVYHPTTGALVVRKTGLSSDGSGVVTISDVLLVPGTSYVYELDLSASTQGRRLPVGVAA